ncbi:MAG: peptidyl-prolyl cis-trans isomerase SurA [Flavobacteriales bacterium]|jgi:peptidyl-prolyl cis-trans isomerase SurA
MKRFTVLLLMLLMVVNTIAQSNQQVIDKVIAVVGDKPIFLSEVQEQMLQAIQQKMPETFEIETSILEEILLEKILLHQAEIDSIEVTEAQVNGELDQRINYFASQMPNGIEDLEKFYEKSIEQIKDEFYTQIENRMKTEQMRQKIIENVRVSPKQVVEFYNSFPEDSIPLVGSKIEYAQITKKPIITSKEKLSIKMELEELRNEILAGKISFGSAAKFKSCDKGSAEKYGDFGMVKRGDFVPQFEAMAYNTEIDSVSSIFETQYGYHILKIEKRRGEQFKGSHILFCFEPSTEQLYSCGKVLDSIKAEIAKGTLTWDDAVFDYSDDDVSKGAQGVVYNQATGTSEWDMNEIDPVTFSAINILKIGEIGKSFIMETFDGKAYKIVKLNKQSDAHKANLNDDYQMVQRFAKQAKEDEALSEWVNAKLGGIYVKLDPKYLEADFEFDWVKAAN